MCVRICKQGYERQIYISNLWLANVHMSPRSEKLKALFLKMVIIFVFLEYLYVTHGIVYRTWKYTFSFSIFGVVRIFVFFLFTESIYTPYLYIECVADIQKKKFQRKIRRVIIQSSSHFIRLIQTFLSIYVFILFR